MACSCKKRMVLEDKYGIKEEETIITKIIRYFFKCVFFLIFVVFAIVLIPILVLSITYQMFFRKNINIVLPNFLGKYMK